MTTNGNEKQGKTVVNWIQLVITIVVLLGTGYYGYGKFQGEVSAQNSIRENQIKSITDKLDQMQSKGSDPVIELKTRVAVLEDRLDRYISRNDEDHKEIKMMLKELISEAKKP